MKVSEPLRSLLRSVRQIFRHEPWWAEFWSACTAMLWGGLSLHSPVVPWPSMQVLLRLGDDRFWSLIGFGLGAMQLAFLLADHRWLRWAGAVALCWFWAVLTLGVWVAMPGAPGTAIYAGWCGINVFSILRLLRHHG